MATLTCRKCGRELSILQHDLCSACQAEQCRFEEEQKRQTAALEATAREAEEQRRERVGRENQARDAELRRRGICTLCEGRKKCLVCGGSGKVVGSAKTAGGKAKGFLAALLFHATGIDKTLDVAEYDPCSTCEGTGSCPTCQGTARQVADISPAPSRVTANTSVADYDCHIGYLFGFGLHSGGDAVARKYGRMIRELQFEPNGYREIGRVVRKCDSYESSPFANAVREIGKIRNRCGLNNPNRFDSDDEFKAKLLWDILSACTDHRGGVSYGDVLDVLNQILEMNAPYQVGLSHAYSADPQGLSAWKAEAERHPPHPSYNPTDYTVAYWRMEFVICPAHLIESLVRSDPLHILKLPGNMREVAALSNEYAEAFFPHEINRRRKKGTWR